MPDFGPGRLAGSLDAIDPGWRDAPLCLAFSGGLDSSVLLHALAALAHEAPLRLRALHVDHGLQGASSDWARRCADACSRAGVPLEVARVAVAPAPGESVEAAAREARYAALAARLAPGERLLTAHQRDDQLETVLIQLFRGAGVAGLAAMPARAPLGAGWQLRPLLPFDRADLEAYADRHGIAAIEDPMNVSLRYDRGWLREKVLPAVRERWPAAAATVARSAAHLAEAVAVLAGCAEADAADVMDADGRLVVAGLSRLPPARQANLLRWWLKRHGLTAPPAVRLAAGLSALLGARADALPVVRWDGGEVRRYRGRLYALPPLAASPSAPVAAGETPVDLGPGLGRFALVQGEAGGLPPEAAAGAVIRFRAGGERLRPHAGRPRKRLKDLCQEAGVVPWMRDRLPLVFLGDRLAAVGDLWVDADLAVPPGRPSLTPVWSGRPPLY